MSVVQCIVSHSCCSVNHMYASKEGWMSANCMSLFELMYDTFVLNGPQKFINNKCQISSGCSTLQNEVCGQWLLLFHLTYN